jgi:F-type H+-transporting ATPase subunit delta
LQPLKSSSATTEAFDNEIITKIKASGYSEVTLEKQIVPELIGGFVLRINDLQFDASLSKQLNRLKREFSNSL